MCSLAVLMTTGKNKGCIMKKEFSKILIADDDELLREAYADFFSSAQYEVATAKNGSDALDLIKANDYDIVFTDYDMPYLNGVELVARCQALEKKLPAFILHTGHAHTKKLGDTSKFSAVLRKGTDVVKLLHTLESVLAQCINLPMGSLRTATHAA